MKQIIKSAFVVARASGANPAIATTTIILFWLMVNMLFMVSEMVIFGERFVHWGDIVLALVAICYTALCVKCCSVIHEDDKAVEIAVKYRKGNS